MGLFAAAPVDWAWVAGACEQMREAVLDEDALEDGQAELLRVSLLQVKGTPDRLRYQVHPLVREFFAVKAAGLATAEALQRGFAQGMTDIAKTIPQVVTLDVRAQVVEAVPHMEEVALRWTEALEGIDKLWCCIWVSAVL